MLSVMQTEGSCGMADFDRRAIIEKIKIIDNRYLQDEIEHLLSIGDREYEYDELTALFDIEDSLKYHWDKTPQNKSLLKLIREIMIDIGYYRPMLSEEIENTLTSNGRVPWDFKLNTIAYTTDYPAEEWMFP